MIKFSAIVPGLSAHHHLLSCAGKFLPFCVVFLALACVLYAAMLGIK